MKKSLIIFGLFSLMMVLTSFNTPNEIGGGTNTPVGQFEIGGGTNTPVGQFEIGGGTNTPVGQ